MSLPTRFVLRSLTAALLFAPVLSAAGPSQDDMKKKYEDKLALEFVEYGGWITDYDAARAKAKEEDKVLFVYFSRSYSP